MGYYLERPDGEPTGKADWLIAHAGAVELPFERMEGSKTHVPVVVVDNGPFEAAAIAFDKDELRVFTDLRDTRDRRYLLVPVAEIHKQHPRLKLAW